MATELKDIQKHYAMTLVMEVAGQLQAGILTEQEAWDKVVIVVVEVHNNTNVPIPTASHLRAAEEACPHCHGAGCSEPGCPHR
jgi:hypothetical protein